METKESLSDTGNPHSPGQALELRDAGSLEKRGPHHLKRDVADADKLARKGARQEPVRDTPPAGKWNDTACD